MKGTGNSRIWKVGLGLLAIVLILGSTSLVALAQEQTELP
jgi:hypothetical protein